MEIATRILWGVLGAYTIVAAIYQWLQLDSLAIPAIGGITALLSCGSIWILRRDINTTLHRFGELLTSTPTWLWVVACLATGIVLRALCAAVFTSDYVSDSAAYWNLAQQLADGKPYGSESSRSFWPPGLPFALTPFIVVFGPELWVPVVFNLLLFTGTAYVALRLAECTAGHAAGRLAILILAIWPNLVLLAGAPHKELLVAFLLPLATLFYIRGAEKWTPLTRSRLSELLGSGICLGFAALTQPAAALFGIVLVSIELLSRRTLFGKAGRLGLVGSLAILMILPWTIRNYAIHGKFVPLNTAGGMVLYSANNPHATGGWIDGPVFAERQFELADEVTRNRLGYRKAFAWISENKTQFVKLMVIKQTRFLCCDHYGAFLLFEHPKLRRGADSMLGMMSGIASNAFWILLALLILCGAIVRGGSAGLKPPLALLVLLGIWYFLAIFSVFQSEGKHHVNVAGFTAIVASWAIPRRDTYRQRNKGS